MIALNQMPISFCTSESFLQFMAIVEPNYKPIKEDALKKMLHALKESIEKSIKAELSKACGVACTSDCWSSAAQESYITMTVHLIDDNWVQKSFTLNTTEMDERHTSENLANKMENIFEEWKLNDKIVAIVTGNVANVVKAVRSIEQVQEKFDVTCAAHSLQLAVNNSLLSEDIQFLVTKASKIVGHFKHSNVAKYALKEKQKQLGLPVLTLLQSCNTRWNSIFLMLERLTQNRSPVMNVLADREITTGAAAEKLEILEREWIAMENLARVLEPVQMVTLVLCSKDASVYMVRPLMEKLLQEHMMPLDSDSEMIKVFKNTLSGGLKWRFDLEWNSELNIISTRQITSMLDPRYKDLDHESHDAKLAIRNAVKELLKESAMPRCRPRKTERGKWSSDELRAAIGAVKAGIPLTTVIQEATNSCVPVPVCPRFLFVLLRERL
ncbi:E3 SUMO-protein ligase ZBED1-like [Temnothorax nylanderi]|uniref:E3 SUMO-protein ligase ZBED1-like n=1 Tax=Temnothorax nylanderi TaxID=102681 RepID=UPI003A8B6297